MAHAVRMSIPGPGLGDLDQCSPPWPATEIELGGNRVNVRRTPGGAGAEPGLYLHGLGGSSLAWTDLAALLSPLVDGHALDFPGHGYSGPAADGDYSVDRLVRLTIEYLERIGPAHVVGNSLGGAVAVRVAGRRPDLVRTLTLISPAFPDLRPQPRRLAYLPLSLPAVPMLGGWAAGLMARVPPEQQVRAEIAAVWGGDPSGIDPVRLGQDVTLAADRAAMSWSAVAVARTFNSLLHSWTAGRGRHWGAARAVLAPALVIWGEADRLVGVGLARRVAEAIPGGRLRVLEGVGHMAQREAPVESAAAIADLVRSAAARVGSGVPNGAGGSL